MDERGIPLEDLVLHLKMNGKMLDWLDFYNSALRAGWKPSRTYSKLSSVVGDVYGHSFLKEWQERFLRLAEPSPTGK